MTHTTYTRHAAALMVIRLAVILLVAGTLTACTGRHTSPGASASYGPQVVHFAGVQQVLFGDLKVDLTRNGELVTPAQGCRPILTGASELGPVFDGERLVLIWVNPPYQTPEGVTVGTPVSEVHSRYPGAQPLTPPPGSYAFPGLLVTRHDRAYLFLHDGQTVQKVVVGFTEYANRLYRDGFGQC